MRLYESPTSPFARKVRVVLIETGLDKGVEQVAATGGPLDPSGYALAHGFFRALGTDQMYSALSIDCPSKFLVPELVAGVQLQFQLDLAHTEHRVGTTW